MTTQPSIAPGHVVRWRTQRGWAYGTVIDTARVWARVRRGPKVSRVRVEHLHLCAHQPNIATREEVSA